jgi:biopolymer transport protein ExbD
MAPLLLTTMAPLLLTTASEPGAVMRTSRWYGGDDFEIAQTPLIDIIFILIIFFLVATTFSTDERDLDIELPEGGEGTPIMAEEQKVVVNIRAGGVIVVRSRVLTVPELDSELAAVAAAEKPPPVEIRGDTNARHGRIMEVMNLCSKHGITDYSLTQRLVAEAP